jgi:hypothetical protein
MDTIRNRLSEAEAICSLSDMPLVFSHLKAADASSHEEAIHLKRRVVAEIKSHNSMQLAINKHTESSIQYSAPFEHAGHVFQYNYQREDLVAKKGDPYFGALTEAREHAQGSLSWYANSGMASIVGIVKSAISLAIKKGAQLEVSTLRGTHYETLLLLNREKEQSGGAISLCHYRDMKQLVELECFTDNVFRLLWLDTSSAHFDRFCDDLDSVWRFDAIVIDTTCALRTDPVLNQICSAILKRRLPLFLVRSHLKLDFLGCEYGRLGSAVIFLPRDGDAVKNGLAIGLCQELQAIRSIYGLNASLDAIYPSFMTTSLDDISMKRLNGARSACATIVKLLTDKLSSDAFAIRKFWHGLYFCIDFKEGLLQSRLGDDFAINVSRRLNEGGIPSRVMPSFGTDYLSFVTFENSDVGGTTTRISVPDISISAVERAANDIVAECIEIPSR